MKRKFYFILIALFCITLFGCKKEVTIKDLREIEVEIEDRLADGGNYDNFLSCSVDEKLMKVIIELIDNSLSKQEEFKNNIYDSEYITFRQGGEYETSREYEMSLETKEETVSRISLTATLNNESDKDYYYDEKYYIEVLNGDNFEKLDYLSNANFGWNDKLNIIKNGSTIDISFDWKNIYGELPNGNYQIVKDVCPDSKCIEKENVYTEFTIE